MNGQNIISSEVVAEVMVRPPIFQYAQVLLSLYRKYSESREGNCSEALINGQTGILCILIPEFKRSIMYFYKEIMGKIRRARIGH